jgi:uncharacterized protein
MVASNAQDLDFRVPQLTSPVVDQAGILSPEGRARAESLIRRLQESGGSQLAVLTLSSLGGLTIEEVGIKVGDAWKLGTKEKDDGVILLIAPKERRMRIEVGQGKEGDLPDALSRRIITDVIGPQFRAGRYDDGILLGVAAIIQKTDPQFDLDAAGISRSAVTVRRDKPGKSFTVFPFIIFILIVMRILRGLHAGVRTPFNTQSSLGRRYGGSSGHYWGSGGGSGWGGGSGGGYSGGGGGFSGGGSSGSW